MEIEFFDRSNNDLFACGWHISRVGAGGETNQGGRQKQYFSDS